MSEPVEPAVTMKEIYWLAGLLEGEGHFSHKSAFIQLGMTDEEIVRRAATIMKTTVRGPSSRNGWKPLWYTAAYGGNAAGWMMTLYPILSQRLRIKIQAAIAIWKKQKIQRRLGVPSLINGKLNPEYTAAYNRYVRRRKKMGYV